MKNTKLKIYTLAIILFSGIAAYSQAPNWLWAKRGIVTGVGANGSTNGTGIGVATDVFGNIYVTGRFDSPTITFGSYTLINAGNANTFLVKYDALGNVLWARSSGGTNLDVGFSVATDAAGNVYVTGEFMGPTTTFGTYTLTTVFCDVFLAKYDTSGNLLWVKSSAISNYVSGGVANVTIGSGVATDNSGNVFVTGWFTSSTITFGPYTLTNTGYWDAFLVKYNSLGNVLWAKNISGTNLNYDEGYSVTTDGSGNVYATGVRGHTCFLSKYDAFGNMLWNKSESGTAFYSAGSSVTTDISGNIYITGIFEGSTIVFNTCTLTNAGSGNTKDIFLVKYDVSGNVIWAKSAGGINNDEGHSVATDASGNVYMMGGFSKLDIINFGMDTLTPPTGSDYPMFIVKFDSSGNELCASALASGGDGYGYDYNAVATDTTGNAYICGKFGINPFVVGTDTLLLSGSGNIVKNVFVAKYTCDCNVFNINPQTICNGGSYVLNGHTYTTTGNYKDTLTAVNGCDSIITTQLTVNPVFLANNPQTICDGSSYVCNGHTYTTTGNYYDTLTTVNGCDSIIITDLTVKPLPFVDLGNDTVLCQSVSLILNAGNPGYAYLWSTGASSQTILVTSQGTYWVSVSDQNCSGVDTIVVSAISSPNLGVDITMCKQNPIDLNAGASAGNYFWSTGENTQTIVVTQPGIYWVQISEANCLTSDTIVVNKGGSITIYFPNTFTPDGDGLNDIFTGYGEDIEMFNMKIFNKWGNLIFETDDFFKSWDGKYEENPVQSDIYVWVVDFKTSCSDEKIRHEIGKVFVLR